MAEAAKRTGSPWLKLLWESSWKLQSMGKPQKGHWTSRSATFKFPNPPPARKSCQTLYSRTEVYLGEHLSSYYRIGRDPKGHIVQPPIMLCLKEVTTIHVLKPILDTIFKRSGVLISNISKTLCGHITFSLLASKTHYLPKALWNTATHSLYELIPFCQVWSTLIHSVSQLSLTKVVDWVILLTPYSTSFEGAANMPLGTKC